MGRAGVREISGQTGFSPAAISVTFVERQSALRLE